MGLPLHAPGDFSDTVPYFDEVGGGYNPNPQPCHLGACRTLGSLPSVALSSRQGLNIIVIVGLPVASPVTWSMSR